MLLTDEDLIDYLRNPARLVLTVSQRADDLERRRAARRWVTKCPAFSFPGCGWRAGPSQDRDQLLAMEMQHLAGAHPGVDPHYPPGPFLTDPALWSEE